MNKILIIDDDRELCALIKRSVQAENIEADFCNTGKEGLQKLREQEYQLVVLDVLLFGETEEKAALITDYGKDVIQLEQRMAELAAADAARTKKHHERYAAAPEH